MLLSACHSLASCAEPAEQAGNLHDMQIAPVAKVERLVVARGEGFTCTPVRVWDGDGPIWCAEGPRIRLAGINAREMDGSCRPGAPCVEASGEQAKVELVALLGGSRGTAREGHAIVAGPLLTCTSNGSAGRDRTGAWCDLPDGRSLNCEMMRTRTVARWPAFDTQGRLTRCE